MESPDQTSLQLGCWIGLPSPQVADIVGGTGFDFAVLDLEHGQATLEQAAVQIIALSGSGTKAFVRVPEAREAWIKRALDAGADGLIVPRVQSAAEAEAIVSLARYAPGGARGEALPIVRATRWGRDQAGYRERAARLPIMAQIESEAGLAAAAEISAVPGITHLFFGPADFAASAGLAPGDLGIDAAMRRVAEQAQAAGIGAGTVSFLGADLALLQSMGYRMIAVASDIALLVTSLDTALVQARHG